MPFMTQILDLLLRFLDIDTGTDVNADTEFGFIGTFDVERNQRRKHFQRKVIDTVITQIFELFEGYGFS